MAVMMSTTCSLERLATCSMWTPTLRNIPNEPKTHNVCQVSFAVKKVDSFSFSVVQLTWQENGGPTLTGVDMNPVEANRQRADAMRSAAVSATTQATYKIWAIAFINKLWCQNKSNFLIAGYWSPIFGLYLSNSILFYDFSSIYIASTYIGQLGRLPGQRTSLRNMLMPCWARSPSFARWFKIFRRITLMIQRPKSFSFKLEVNIYIIKWMAYIL